MSDIITDLQNVAHGHTKTDFGLKTCLRAAKEINTLRQIASQKLVICEAEQSTMSTTPLHKLAEKWRDYEKSNPHPSQHQQYRNGYMNCLADCAAELEEALVEQLSPLDWHKGPAMGGSGTHGKNTWWDGEKLLVIIHHKSSRSKYLVHVSADVGYCALLDENGDDIGYEPEDVAWWCKLESSNLPPYTPTPDQQKP